MLRSMTLACAVLLGFAATAGAQGNPDWDKIVAATKQEGSVVLYTGLPGNPSTKKLTDAFQKKYGIRVDVLELRASELREKIRTEFVTGRTLGDVSNTSPNQTRQFAEEDGAIEAYGPLPNLARIAPDTRAIWQQQTPAIQLPIFNLYYGLLINTAQVKDPPKGYADLLDARFKSKILADDFRPTGGGHSFHSVTHTAFGNAYHEKLFANQITFTRDQREAERRVGRSEYQIYLPFLLTNYPSLKGLPVKAVALQEGVTLTPYSAGLMKKAPHPNAARVLMDFMLSDEAQAAYAGEGLMPVVSNMMDKLPEDLRPFGTAKILGTSLWENETATYAAAKEVYK